MLIPIFNRIRVGSLDPPSVPGSQGWGYGSRAVVIPVYKTLTMQIWGPGGGGASTEGGDDGYQPNTVFGGTGQQSYFSFPGGTLVANGGTGGGNANYSWSTGGVQGSPGTASGGMTNTTGGGNAGGSGGPNVLGYQGGAGGRGGFVSRTWNWFDPGAPVAGSSYTLFCGAGGGPSPDATGYGGVGAGANASASMSWT